jgi:fucose permease
MALSTYAEEFSPGREDRAVLSLNALLGTGTAMAPLLVAIFIGLGAWWLLPLAVATALAGLLLVSAREPLKASAGEAAGATGARNLPPGFWLFAAAVLLYGIAETLCGNWSGPYLTGDRGVSVQGASLSLTAFWAMVTIGRLLFAALSSTRIVRWIFTGLPVVLIAAFQLISHARAEIAGIVAFGVAGLGCSAFFPLCFSLSAQKFPRFATAMSGQLIAFYQVGYGVAAFGAGPLRDLTGGPFGIIYFFGSLVAVALLITALAATARVDARLDKVAKIF